MSSYESSRSGKSTTPNNLSGYKAKECLCNPRQTEPLRYRLCETERPVAKAIYLMQQDHSCHRTVIAVIEN